MKKFIDAEGFSWEADGLTLKNVSVDLGPVVAEALSEFLEQGGPEIVPGLALYYKRGTAEFDALYDKPGIVLSGGEWSDYKSIHVMTLDDAFDRMVSSLTEAIYEDGPDDEDAAEVKARARAVKILEDLADRYRDGGAKS